MSGLLSDIFSWGDTQKRRLRGLLEDPAAALALGITRAGEDQQGLLNMAADAGWMPGQRSVLTSPQQQAAARKALADAGAQMAMAATFIGQSSPSWDVAKANKAHQMLARGDSGEKVHAATGTWVGADGRPRQEISDHNALFQGFPQKPTPVSGVYRHPELEAAYPDAMQMRTMYSPSVPLNTLGQYGVFHGEEGILGGIGGNSSTMAHELQHAIQQREGWAKGGSPSSFGQQKEAELARDALSWRTELLKLKKAMPDADTIALENIAVKQYQDLGIMDMLPSREARDLARQPSVLFPDKYPGGQAADLDELVNLYGLNKKTTPATDMELYRRLAGEAEARLTQARLDMTPAQRAASYPPSMFDVPIDQQIVRFK